MTILILLAIVGLAVWAGIRYKSLIMKKTFQWFRKVLPPMSETEKEAIEAGDVWWEKELFQGNPNWNDLFSLPAPQLSAEEQAFLDNQVDTFCAMLDDWQIVHEQSDLSSEAWEYLKKEKFFGMIIPKKYGGLEFSPQAHSAVVMKIATRSVSAAVTVMVPNSLGPAELLLQYGTEQQKDNYLAKLASGQEIPCFALTGPEAGSDAGAIPDQGVVAKGMHNGKEVIGIRLTFDKRYITLAPVATVLGLAFKMSDPDHLLSDKTDLGITLCLLPTDHPGVQIGSRHFPLNMAFMNGPVRGKDVFIPMEWVIGGVDNVGKGWRMLMECLSAGRGISLPALSAASGLVAFCATGAYASIRRQFNLPLKAFEGVEEALTRIAGFTYLLQATRLFTISAIAAGKRPGVATAMTKYHMTELARKIIIDAMDVHGGRGIMLGPHNYLGRAYQAMPISITVEGANILTRNLMIFGQGAIRCHPYVTALMKAAEEAEREPQQAQAAFEKNVVQYIRYFSLNFVRSITFSFSRGLLCLVPCSDERKKYLKKLTWFSTALAVCSDVALMVLGGELKRKEKLSARLGDVLSQLYLASAVLKYYSDQNKPAEHWPVVEWICQTCLYSAQEAYFLFFDNFPNRIIGALLKISIFPYGRAFSAPKDKLSHDVAKAMTQPSALRNLFSQQCYREKEATDPLGLLELAFESSLATQPAMHKLFQAIKEKQIGKNLNFVEQIEHAVQLHILTQEEADALKSFELLRKQVIAVDEFTSDIALGTQRHGT